MSVRSDGSVGDEAKRRFSFFQLTAEERVKLEEMKDDLHRAWESAQKLVMAPDAWKKDPVRKGGVKERL
jgi:hypothetical protein